MGFAPNMAQKIVVTGFTTADGSSYGRCYFTPGRGYVQCDFTNGSTGVVDFKLQGSNSTSGLWFNLLGAPSTVSTGATVCVKSTGVFVFDRVRVMTTDASASTKSATYTWWISAR